MPNLFPLLLILLLVNNAGFSYGDYGGGTFWGEDNVGISADIFDLNISFAKTINNEGITNDHPVYEVAAQYGPLGVQGSLQHGKLKTVTPQLLHLQKEIEIAAKDLVCFPAGTEITLSNKTQTNIENIQAGDKVQSWNERTNQFDAVLQ